MRRDDPIYLSKYTCDNDRIYKPGWKQICRSAKDTNKMNCLLKSAKAKQRRNALNIKFGMNIPQYHKEVMMFDSGNGNTNKKDDELL